MIVRSLAEPDAAAYVRFLRDLDAETAFLMWEPGERVLTEADVHLRIEMDPALRATWIAVEDGAIVGFLVGIRGGARRISHRADFTMGVLERAAGRGAGQALLGAFEAWARTHGVRRLELTVMAHNDRAIRLYERVGFVREGIKRQAIVVGGRAVDEVVMGKLLD